MNGILWKDQKLFSFPSSTSLLVKVRISVWNALTTVYMFSCQAYIYAFYIVQGNIYVTYTYSIIKYTYRIRGLLNLIGSNFQNNRALLSNWAPTLTKDLFYMHFVEFNQNFEILKALSNASYREKFYTILYT